MSGRRVGRGGGGRGGSLVRLTWMEGLLATGCWAHGDDCFLRGLERERIPGLNQGLSLTVSPDLGYLLLVVEHM